MTDPLPFSVRAVRKRDVDGIAVDEVPFDVRRGERFGLSGPNGAGKRTTRSTVSTPLRHDAGAILVDGTDAARDPVAVRRRIGLFPQERFPCEEPMAAENFAFFGGQQHEPSRVLLVGPTIRVGPQSRNHLFEMIAALKRAGTTFDCTTHETEEAERIRDRAGVVGRTQMRNFARCTATGWALKGFQGVYDYGKSLADLRKELALLFAFTGALLAASPTVFRRRVGAAG